MSVKNDKTFLTAVEIMENYLTETIKETEKCIKFSKKLIDDPPNNPILEIPEEGHYWQKSLKIYPKVKYVFFYRKEEDNWGAQTNNQKILFPKSWRGKTNKDLEKITEIKNSIFCHKSGFYAVAKTREQIISLIKKSLY